MALGDVADLADAILYIWYPGQEGGRALADVLFGHVAPSGKLPLTFPRSIEQLPPFEEYDMAGRTYRYMVEEPQFPFGFGLSYTSFAYEGIQAPAKIKAGEPLPVQVTVRNSGSVDADEVVQLYLSAAAPAAGDPLYTLVGFSRVQLAAGEAQTVDVHADGRGTGNGRCRRPAGRAARGLPFDGGRQFARCGERGIGGCGAAGMGFCDWVERR